MEIELEQNPWTYNNNYEKELQPGMIKETYMHEVLLRTHLEKKVMV